MIDITLELLDLLVLGLDELELLHLLLQELVAERQSLEDEVGRVLWIEVLCDFVRLLLFLGVRFAIYVAFLVD